MYISFRVYLLDDLDEPDSFELLLLEGAELLLLFCLLPELTRSLDCLAGVLEFCTLADDCGFDADLVVTVFEDLLLLFADSLVVELLL